MVVVEELLRSRHTLMLRLMGRGRALQEAWDDLHTLHEDIWERQVAGPSLRRLRHELAHRGIFITTSENDPMIIDHKIPKAEWEAEKDERAAELARVRDLARADGMRPLIRLLERRIARPLSDAERTGLAARFDLVGPERLGDVVLDLSPDTLTPRAALPKITSFQPWRER